MRTQTRRRTLQNGLNPEKVRAVCGVLMDKARNKVGRNMGKPAR